MITLGIHDGHTATAALARDGKIVACISEERMVREKECGGFPVNAIRRCLEIAQVKPEEIDGVGIVGLGDPTLHKNYEEPAFYKRAFNTASVVLPNSFLRSSQWVNLSQKLTFLTRDRKTHKRHLRDLGIDVEIKYYEHHLLHAMTAHLMCPWGKEENLVLTNDGSGDAVAATVNIGRGNEIERLETISNYNSLGEFYTRTTQFLSMKPMSHEFKVMGLAPYAKETYGLKTYKLMSEWFQFNPDRPLAFENHSGICRSHYIKRFRKLFATEHRFDSVAWAAQHLVEEVQTKWVKNVVEKTGIKNVVLSGGVFLNVKANHLILQLDEIENLFIFPSGGDESLPFGAALLRQVDLGQDYTEPLKTLYFGDQFNGNGLTQELQGRGDDIKYKHHDDIHEHVGRKLNEGNIIARYHGRMEWGARSLGNRSIIADARRPDVIIRINEAIKNRDFWMPFAPSVLFERANDYFENPQEFFGPYMVMAFPSTPLAQEHLKGALHPYDLTGRPQMVKEDWNKEYYAVIKSFEKASGGVGGILNTSFNLHGEAIVRTPKDALETFLNSGLDALAIGNYYVTKKNASHQEVVA